MTEKINLRAVALDILIETESDETKAGELIRSVLDRYGYLDTRDRAFIKKLTEGTLERRITLDYVIDRFSRVKTAKMKPVIREVLRMSVFQLLYMSHVPQSAVCNEAVKLVRKRRMNGLSGFVNGVLRNIIREPVNIEELTDLSVKYSMPAWITERFTEEFGRDTAEDIFRASLESRPVFIRTNKSAVTPDELYKKLTDGGIQVKKIEEHDGAFEVSGYEAIDRIPEFIDGLFSVQDLSSMTVGEFAAGDFRNASQVYETEGAAELSDNIHVIDVCAAPGGKSCHTAELIKGRGTVEARDISDRKIERILENRDRLKLDNLDAVVMDASVHSEESDNTADILICDLPCSGLGVMGRKNELKYRVKPEDIGALAELQREILKASVPYLKTGGRLVFSTCTITHEESTDQKKWIETELGLKLEAERMYLPSSGGADGFYAVSFRKI
ncbi:16S rRNA (cytosine967-C5)-methyltransferase [Lachnospiraceae bacterium]|nr:16S rRNA (cytosine967-C5)-methyltransferase [Lachnospiraceae bacterium]